MILGIHRVAGSRGSTAEEQRGETAPVLVETADGESAQAIAKAQRLQKDMTPIPLRPQMNMTKALDALIVWTTSRMTTDMFSLRVIVVIPIVAQYHQTRCGPLWITTALGRSVVHVHLHPRTAIHGGTPRKESTTHAATPFLLLLRGRGVCLGRQEGIGARRLQLRREARTVLVTLGLPDISSVQLLLLGTGAGGLTKARGSGLPHLPGIGARTAQKAGGHRHHGDTAKTPGLQAVTGDSPLHLDAIGDLHVVQDDGGVLHLAAGTKDGVLLLITCGSRTTAITVLLRQTMVSCKLKNAPQLAKKRRNHLVRIHLFLG